MQENLNDLRAFVVVARLNSFTKAGRNWAFPPRH